MEQDLQKQPAEVIYGRNAVAELLRSGRQVENLYIQKGELKGSIVRIIALAKEKRIPIKEVPAQKLDSLCGKQSHQGVAAQVPAAAYARMEDIFALAEEKNEPLFVVICDEIEDPHNLGAIIRSAECAGAHGVIIPLRRSAGLTPVVYKTSAGACEHLPVVRVNNLVATMDMLKEKGVWVYGADMDGQDYTKTNLSGAVALVIGAEGKGLGRLVKEHCDAILSLPIKGRIDSLNASVAAGILMYEVVRNR